MLQLLPNYAGIQTIYLTLQEAARDYSYTHYLFKLTHRISGKEHFFVADVIADNPRYTAVNVYTDADNVNNVLLTETGYYEYAVYVQTSSSNLDPDEATALVEQGLLYVIGASITTTPSISASDNFVYYGN
jgi:hypothetical protein